MQKKAYRYILLLMIQCCLSIISYSQGFDSTFGNNGKTIIPIAGNDYCKSVALQPDGKIVLAGYSVDAHNNYLFSIARLKPNGILDSTFNSTGIKTFFITANDSSACETVKIGNNNKIITAGYTFTPTKRHFGMSSLNTDGTLNTAFNGNDADTSKFSNDPQIAYYIDNPNYTSMDVSSNRILLAGASAIMVLKPDGSPDSSFNSNGKLLISGFNCYSAIFQKDGKILLVGMGGLYRIHCKIYRLNADGTMDTSFINGIDSIDTGHQPFLPYSMVLQKDGKILVGGRALYGVNVYNIFELLRLNSDGSLDHTFGGNSSGEVSISGEWFSDYYYCSSVAVDTSANTNKIVMTGLGITGHSHSYFAVYRLDKDGNIEAQFPLNFQTTSVAIQPDSKIIVAGYTSNGSNDDFAVIRLLPNFITTGTTVAETSENIGVQLFPNPAISIINIQSSYAISNITLYNTLGEQVISFTNHDSTSANIDISNLTKGLYTAVITTNKGNAVKRLLKQ